MGEVDPPQWRVEMVERRAGYQGARCSPGGAAQVTRGEPHFKQESLLQRRPSLMAVWPPLLPVSKLSARQIAQ